MEMKLDIENINLKVDKNRLDEEAEEFTEQLYEATKNLHKFYEKKKSLNNDLNVLESTLFLKIKSNPEKYFTSVEKAPTDAAINRVIVTLPKVIKLKKKLLDAETLHLKKQNFANVIEAKKSMIKYLQELYLSDYFNTNKVTDDDANTATFRKAKRRLKIKNKEKEKNDNI